MLNRKESEVMKEVFSLCGEEGKCLVAAADLLRALPRKEKFTEEGLERTLRALELDDYFEMISSDRKGEKMYVISLHPKGAAYRRSAVQLRRGLALRLVWTVLSAVLAFFVGLLLRKLFCRRPFFAQRRIIPPKIGLHL